MSCYEWERGTLKFSVSEYGKFKKAFMAGMQDHYNQAYRSAIELHDKILKNAKGKRNVDWHAEYNNCRCTTYSNRDMLYFSKDLDPLGLAFNSMFRKKGDRGFALNVKPLKPCKGDFTLKTKVKNPSFSFEDAGISFDDKNRTVCWIVEENNHARESAHNHGIGKLFFCLLGSVNWTRGTGGQFVGNDEYNGDSDYAGGGGNYVTMRFGPLGK